MKDDFSNHIQDKINKAYAMLGVIKRTLQYLQLYSFILLYKNMVRSHLDYCSSVWTPYRKGDIEDLEKVQKRATMPELKGIKYCDRPKGCKLPTLHYRRLRGDMIETFKIVSGKYDSCAAPIVTGLHSIITRGRDLRLEKFSTRTFRPCVLFGPPNSGPALSVDP